MGLLDDAFASYYGAPTGILAFRDRLLSELQPELSGRLPGPPGWLPQSAMGAASGPRIPYTPVTGEAPSAQAPAPVAMPQLSTAPSEPGIGDRLGAGFQSFANSGSLLGAIGNLFGALGSGKRTDPLGMALQQQQDTFNYLVKSGTPPDQAAIIAQSPKAQELYIQQMIAPKYQPQKLQGLTGEEPVTFDATRGIWLDAAGKPLGTNSGIGIPRGPDGQPLEGTALLQHYEKADPAAASMIKAIIRGDAGVTGRNLQKFMPIATLVDPTLSQFNYDTRKKTALDFAPSGKSATNVKSLETVGGHIDKMMDAYDKLGNTWSPEYNSVKNWIATRLGAGGVNAYETAANGVANELGTVFRSYGMSDAEVKSWRDRIATANSPEQFQAGMGMLLDMLKTRKEALQEQYQQGLGRPAPPEMFQKLDVAIGKIQGRIGGSQLPSQAAAPAIAEGSTATNPKTGQRLVYRGGQWMPLQ